MSVENLIEQLLALTGFYSWEKITIAHDSTNQMGDVEFRRYVKIPFTQRRWCIDRAVIDYDDDLPSRFAP